MPRFPGAETGETRCGLEVWRYTPSEAETILGVRLEIAGGINHKVTCRACVRAAKNVNQF